MTQRKTWKMLRDREEIEVKKFTTLKWVFYFLGKIKYRGFFLFYMYVLHHSKETVQVLRSLYIQLLLSEANCKHRIHRTEPEDRARLCCWEHRPATEEELGSVCHSHSHSPERPRMVPAAESAQVKGKRESRAAPGCVSEAGRLPQRDALPGCGLFLLQRAGDGSTGCQQGGCQADSVGGTRPQPCSRGQLRPHQDVHARNISET